MSSKFDDSNSPVASDSTDTRPIIVDSGFFLSDDSGDYLRGVVENLIDVYFRIDDHGTLLQMSPSGAKLFGYASVDEMIGINMVESLYQKPADHGELIEILVKKHKVVGHQIIAKKKNGATLFLEASARLVCNPAGDTIGVEGIFRDNTDRQKMEQFLRLWGQQWQSTFDALEDLVAMIDRDHRIVKANRAFKEALGNTDVEGMHCYKIMHNADKRPKHCMANCTFTTGEPVQMVIQEEHFGGRWFDLHVAPIKDNTGEVQQVVHALRDVTEYRRVVDQQRTTNKQTARFLDALPHGVFVVDETGKPLYANEKAKELLGKGIVPRTNVKNIGVVYRAFVAGTEEEYPPAEMPIVRALSGEKSTVDNMIIKHPDKTIPIEVFGAPVTDEDGKILHALAVFHDITERRVLERQLLQSQKLESIGQLAAGIAHEINTPAQYVGDNTRFLQESFKELTTLFAKCDGFKNDYGAGKISKDEVFKKVEEAAEEADIEFLAEEIPQAIEQTLEGITRIAQIVRAMKEFAHPGTEEKRYVDLNHAIETTVTISRNEWKYVADVETDLCPDLPQVPCLPGEFNQALLNIVVNAAQAIGEQQEASGDKTKGTISVQTSTRDDTAEIRISDTGPGIPDEIKERIFDPFFTTKEVGKGTGQGLAIVHSVVVDKHDGTLRVETNPGQGTTFVIRLPIE